MMERALLLGLFTVGVGTMWLIGQWETIAERQIEGDIIRALSLVIPLMGAFTLWWLKQTADEKTRKSERADKQQRMLIALHAEIDLHLESYLTNFGPEKSAKTLSGMLKHLKTTDAENEASGAEKTREKTMPTSVVQKENTVFDQVKPNITELPAEIIGAVIQYYQTDAAVLQLAKSFNEGLFEERSLGFREKIIVTYVAAIHEGALDALHAVKCLDEMTRPSSVGATEAKKEEMREVRTWLLAHRTPQQVATLQKGITQ